MIQFLALQISPFGKENNEEKTNQKSEMPHESKSDFDSFFSVEQNCPIL
jgi:hypothetical protein